MVLQGRKDAFATLVARYQDYVFALVLRYIAQREEAEEIAQDVFIKAYRSLASFKGESRFSTWLYTIAHTTCISHLRKKPSGHIATDHETMAALPLGGTLAAPTLSERKSQAAMLEQAIGRLSAGDAQVVTLFYQGEQSIEEIARILDASPNTIKVKLHRARGRLREILVRLFPVETKEYHYVPINTTKNKAHE